MKKNIRIMIITVAAVIILVAMLLILMNLPSSDGGGASSTASSTSISLNTKTADDVSKVEVKNNSDSYTVEMKSEDSYSVEGLDGFDLNKTSISALKSDSAGVAATQLVEEQAEDLSIYGLDSPKAEAKITYKDGETLSLAVGNEAAGDAGTYVTVNGESKVYLRQGGYLRLPSAGVCFQGNYTLPGGSGGGGQRRRGFVQLRRTDADSSIRKNDPFRHGTGRAYRGGAGGGDFRDLPVQYYLS